MNSNLHLLKNAISLHQTGKLDDAEALYRRILHTEPANPEALHLLGVIAFQRGKYDEAKDLINRAIALNKRAAEYRNNLGNVYLSQKKLDQAEECYLKALKLQPRYTDARNNMGNVYREQGKLQEAAAAYQKALDLDPNRPDIHNNLGLVSSALGRAALAIDHYLQAIRLKPDFVDAQANLSVAYTQQGCLQEAIENGIKVLALDPRNTKVLVTMGNAYAGLGQTENSIVFYRQALNVNPELCEAHQNFGHALRQQGKSDEAMTHYQKAIELNPKLLSARLGHCIGQIPLLHDSREHVVQTRENYGQALELLCQDMNLADPYIRSQARTLVGNCQPFFLAYQGENDRDLQSQYGALVTRIQSSCYPQWSIKRQMPPLKPGEPIRVGIVSGFFYLHSNWKIPIKGWIENLNPQEFQLFGYYTGRKVDDQTETAKKSFHRFVQDLPSHEEWCECILKDNLHILIFPEIGMESMTSRLASLRLAPVQCTSWGHPDTSGFPTIDYYLSSDLMEPDNGQEHYCEKLIRLPNLSIYYEPIDIEAAPVTRADFGLRADCPLFICTQSLFKYLPQYDEVFPRIVAEVGDCQFAFLNYAKSPLLGDRFMRRLQASFSRFGLPCEKYAKLLSSLDAQHYRTLNQLADVFLDSIGWSGCNSTMEALACNLPVVTMPGTLMRGRHTHAILKMMGLTDTECTSMDAYVSIAKRLVQEPEWRAEISRRISVTKHRAYRDIECIRGLQDFMRQTVRASV